MPDEHRGSRGIHEFAKTYLRPCANVSFDFNLLQDGHHRSTHRGRPGSARRLGRGCSGWRTPTAENHGGVQLIRSTTRRRSRSARCSSIGTARPNQRQSSTKGAPRSSPGGISTESHLDLARSTRLDGSQGPTISPITQAAAGISTSRRTWHPGVHGTSEDHGGLTSSPIRGRHLASRGPGWRRVRESGRALPVQPRYLPVWRVATAPSKTGDPAMTPSSTQLNREALDGLARPAAHCRPRDLRPHRPSPRRLHGPPGRSTPRPPADPASRGHSRSAPRSGAVAAIGTRTDLHVYRTSPGAGGTGVIVLSTPSVCDRTADRRVISSPVTTLTLTVTRRVLPGHPTRALTRGGPLSPRPGRDGRRGPRRPRTVVAAGRVAQPPRIPDLAAPIESFLRNTRRERRRLAG